MDDEHQPEVRSIVQHCFTYLNIPQSFCVGLLPSIQFGHGLGTLLDAESRAPTRWGCPLHPGLSRLASSTTFESFVRLGFWR